MEFKINLFDIESIQHKLIQYEKDVDKAVKNGLSEFAEKYEDKLFYNASKYGVPYSVIEDLNVTIIDYEIHISLAGKELFFYEYGTGVRGQGSPHPKDPWDYDIHNHGEAGWNYVVTKGYHMDVADYVFNGKNGEILAHTKGMPSKPFIYDTWLWGRRSIYNIIKKHLNRVR